MKVNLGKVFSNDSSRIEMHKRVLNRRHKAVAHSDWEYHKSELQEVIESGGVVRKHSVVIYGEGIDIKMFREMAETMGNHFRHAAYDRDAASAGKG
jgi:hypothetical protein